MAGAEVTTLARPYARAAFSQAVQADGKGKAGGKGKQAQGLAAWSRMLAFLAEAASAEPLQRVMANPLLSAGDKAAAFAQVLEGELTDEGQRLLALLAEHGRLPLLPQVATLFENLRAQHQKTVNVSLVSAFEVSKKQAQELAAALTRRLKREVSLSASQDPALIGGALVKVEDTVMDGSVRGRLQKLSQALS